MDKNDYTLLMGSSMSELQSLQYALNNYESGEVVFRTFDAAYQNGEKHCPKEYKFSSAVAPEIKKILTSRVKELLESIRTVAELKLMEMGGTEQTPDENGNESETTNDTESDETETGNTD